MKENGIKRIATRKAVDEFCKANGIDSETINAMFHGLFPGKYTDSDEIPTRIIKGMVREYDSVDRQDIEAYMKKLEGKGEFARFDRELIRRNEMRSKLSNLLWEISRKAAAGDVRLSQFPVWNEVRDYALSECGSWDVYDENGSQSLEKVLHEYFMHKVYIIGKVPFNCYVQSDGDVLFTKSEFEWVPMAGKYENELTNEDIASMKAARRSAIVRHVCTVAGIILAMAVGAAAAIILDMAVKSGLVTFQ